MDSLAQGGYIWAVFRFHSNNNKNKEYEKNIYDNQTFCFVDNDVFNVGM